MTVGKVLQKLNTKALDGKCFIWPRNISWQDQKTQWMVEEYNLKELFVQVDYEDEIVISKEADLWT